MAGADRPSTGATVAAFAAVYLIWGSTYLGIAVVVTHLPPLLSAAARFLAPGLGILAFLRMRGAAWPTPRQWGWAFVTGALMLGAGNGFLSVAERRMPSGVAALVVCTVPLWLTLLEWLPPYRRRPSASVAIGLAMGMAGVATLAWNPEGWRGGLDARYILLVALGSLAWAAGSLLGRHGHAGQGIAQAVGSQMAAGGLLLAIAGTAAGEWHGLDLHAPARAWLALAYLSVFGSIVALGAYHWLLRWQPAPLVGTYAFVNPLVAMALGTLLLGEPIGWRLVAAASLVLGGVCLILWARARPSAPKPAGHEASTGRESPPLSPPRP